MGIFLCTASFGELPLIGTYQTIDDETGQPKSIVKLYEYKNGKDVKLAGRIIALYDENGVVSETLGNPVKVAYEVSGSPNYVGLDIIWGMTWDEEDSEYRGGKIMDPKKGSIYSSVIWQDSEDKLQVRGKIGPFGKTQTWNMLNPSDLPLVLQGINEEGWNPTIRK